MKKPILLLTIALLLTACGGNKSNQNKASNEIKWENGDICAVVFLGYGKDFSVLKSTDEFKDFCKQFPSLKEMKEFTVATEGDEIYYIIPRYADAKVTVNEYQFDIELMEEIIGNELYNGDSEPILIRCNFSDLHPNTFIKITGNNENVTFNPMSLMTGQTGVQIVSLNQTLSAEAPLLSTECKYKGVRATIENGKVFLHFNQAELRVTDYYEVSYTLEKKPYLIEGMSGACKGVLIGDVGQDEYPVLACLLEDGGIEIMDIYQAIRDHDFRSSGRLREFENIITIVNEVVSYSDEGGGYIALFAVIAEGNKIEIYLNPVAGQWFYQVEGENGVEHYSLSFTKDWKMTFNAGYADSEAFISYEGTCRMLSSNYNNDKFTAEYECTIKESDRSEMTGEAPDPTIITGAFKMREISENVTDGFGITCTEGMTFYPGKLGEEIIFKMQHLY